MAPMLRKVLVFPGGIAPERAHRLLEQGFALVIHRESNSVEEKAPANAFHGSDRTATIVRTESISD